MNIWLGSNLSPTQHASAVTIGNFDGVHSGHLHILQRLKNEATHRGLQSVVVIFEPQPNEFFARQHHRSPIARLTPLRDKLQLLQQSQCVDEVYVLRFNHQFAQMPASSFIQTILRERLNTRYLLVGDDFRFGQARTGDFDLLRCQPDFITERTPSILIAGERASSTAVRQALNTGRLDQARQILGHDYQLSGRVKHGKKLGRTLGSPTANIHLPPHHYALHGVFVVEATSPLGKHQGVANFGSNPTVEQTHSPKLEVHLLDFQGNLYGKRLSINFLHKLRDEQKFASLEKLVQQIHADMDAARNWWADA